MDVHILERRVLAKILSHSGSLLKVSAEDDLLVCATRGQSPAREILVGSADAELPRRAFVYIAVHIGNMCHISIELKVIGSLQGYHSRQTDG